MSNLINKKYDYIRTCFLCRKHLIDLLMFSKGSMAMPIIEYFKDIGLTNLLIPAIIIGFGYLLDEKRSSYELSTY